VRELLRLGWPYNRIRSEVGCSKSTIAHHAKALGLSSVGRPTYDWERIQKAISEGANFPECHAEFGIPSCNFYRAIKIGKIIAPNIRPPTNKITIQELARRLSGRTGRNPRSKMKAKLLSEGAVEYRCAICGLDNWLGHRLPLRLDHQDGDPANWELSNLRLLCGNCDSIQDTFCHRNVGRAKKPVALPLS
jgi:5-methylcytosine-specific restriction endonuclease McrA